MTTHEPPPAGEPRALHEPPPGARFMNGVRWVLFAGLLVLASVSVTTWVLTRKAGPVSKAHVAEARYRCPMHPSYTSDRPGECPICGMSLEPIPHDGAAPGAAAGDVPGLATVQLSPERIQLIGVRTARVERRAMGGATELVGFVTPDESRYHRVQLRVSGWVQGLQVDRTGDLVRAGQPLLSIYSPELSQSEQEYLIERNAAPAASAPDHASHDAGGLSASRQRLAAMGVPAEEIARLERERTPSSKLVLRAPVDGTVLEKNVVDGQYVGPDTPLFTIADLARVWVLADVYAIDMAGVRVGDRATFVIDGDPGRSFAGRIDFVYPTVSTETRTVKARVALDNPRGQLRPGMYGRVRVAGGGGPALSVPGEAVIHTGEHHYVFVARGGGRFEPRLVTLGRQGGDRVEIRNGLAEGDTVVASASFLVDSESRLKAAVSGSSR